MNTFNRLCGREGCWVALLCLVISPAFVYAQEEKDTNNPAINIRVEKETDEHGNIIRYDSTYQWSWSGRMGLDSLLERLNNRFEGFHFYFPDSLTLRPFGFYSFPDSMSFGFFPDFRGFDFFDPGFLNDSLYMAPFPFKEWSDFPGFNQEQFMKRMEEMQRRMEEMFKYYQRMEPSPQAPPTEKKSPSRKKSKQEGVDI